ncbi:unnamed protein product [Schistosoma curassoni]|uniref:Enhancer of mRNA-decapping protein 4 n=1 Tax=Schistosoma curassoni TaxID=6186 RepID=A0A183JV96_9TREM|nr:unnamed protein product [Schistosoma curassoni]
MILRTASSFKDHPNGVDDDGDAWPPFRQAGVFDPFMDDSRVAIQFIYLVDNTLVVGGAAGQVRYIFHHLSLFLYHKICPLIPSKTLNTK